VSPVDPIFDIDILARTLHGEGRGEPWEVIVGFGWAIRNRVKQHGWWGSGWADVCRKRIQRPTGEWVYQFSCWDPNDPNHDIIQSASLLQSSFRRSYMAALNVYDGISIDPTGGATNYFSPKVGLPPPYWITKMDQTADLNGNLFFKERQNA
jgi:spore germination cell wall hydrolase CwlJ-like protein